MTHPEASVSTTVSRSGWNWARTGAVVKAFLSFSKAASACEVREKSPSLDSFLVSAVSGVTISE